MSQWSLLHMNSPRNTTSGTGLVRELTKASSRSLQFSLYEPATLTFTLPGNDPQTAALLPLRDDVLVYRDDVPVQRFRVVSRVLEKADGIVTANFSAISYKGLMAAAIFHPEYTRTFAASAEQTLTAWGIMQAAFGATNTGPQWLGITGRRTPATGTNATYPAPPATDNQKTSFFEVGQTIRDGIDVMASPATGFEWDIIPHPSNPYTQLYAGFWNKAETSGGRNQFGAGRSPFLLTDGGTLASWSHTVTPEYANVIRFTGDVPTSENNTNGVASTSVWVPVGKVPSEITPPGSMGRWERDIQQDGQATATAIATAASAAFDAVNLYTPEISVDLARGRWAGPSQLWLGDKARLIITEPVAGVPGSYVIYIDEDVKVVEVAVSVDDLGAEDVSLALNRPKYSSVRDAKEMYDRVKNLKRR